MVLTAHGRTIDEIYWTPCVEFDALCRADDKAEQVRWERARWQSYISVLLSPFVKNKPASPTALARFPWEDGAPECAAYDISDEEREELFRIMDNLEAKRNGQDR